MSDLGEEAFPGGASVGDTADEDEAWEDEAEWRGHDVARPWWGWTAFVLSVAGFGVSLYLTIDHFTGSLPICSASGIVDCTKVTTSPESEIFGVFPVSLLGLLFFTGMVMLNVPRLWRWGGRFGRWLSFARLAMVVVGIGMVLYLLAAELFSIKAICLWCTGIHIVTFLLFVLVMATFPTMASAPGAERD